MLKKFRNNPVFRMMDKIPFLRRSGTASLGDLGKALGIALALSILVNLPTFMAHPSLLLITLLAVAPIVGLILFAHPFLSHRATLTELFAFKKRRK